MSGSRGPQGAQGAQGCKGIDGKGIQGAQGAQGAQGTPGKNGWDGQIGSKGPQGDKGDKGNKGSQGYQGEQGPTGKIGCRGDQGYRGPTGDRGVPGWQGVQGFQGDTGFKGPQGDGSSMIYGTATDNTPDETTYTGLSNVYFDSAAFSIVEDGSGIIIKSTGTGSGSGSGSGSSTDVEKYITDPPPKISFGSVTTTSKYIYIPWRYPHQVRGGLLDVYLPLLCSFTCKLSADISGTPSYQLNYTIPDLSGVFTNCIKYNGHNLNTPYITGLVLTNVPTKPSGVYSLSELGLSSDPSYAYLYYLNDFVHLINNNNKITAYYQNYNDMNYIASDCSFGTFSQVNPPIAPSTGPNAQITTGFVVSNVLYYNATIITGTITSATIPSTGIVGITTEDPYNPDGYTIKYYRANLSSSPSSKRYTSGTAYNGVTYGDVSDNRNVQSAVTDSSSILVTNLYPDSTYNVTTSANNTSSNALFGYDSSSSTLVTYGIPPSILSFTAIAATTPIASATCSARLVGTTTNFSVYTNVTSITSAPIYAPIQSPDYRGSTLANKLLDINCNVVRNGQTIATAGPLIYKGFGQPVPSTITDASGITITPTSITDAYITAANYLQGYYLNASFQVDLSGSTIFTDSKYPTTCTLIQKQYDDTGTALGSQLTNSSSSFSFYRDSFSIIPDISSCDISLNSATSFTQISGVYCATTNMVKLNATTIAQNVGQYFYNNNTLLTYQGDTSGNITGTTTETSMPSGYYDTNTNKINPSITFENTSGGITYTNNGIWANGCSIKATPWSWKSTSADGNPGTSTSIPIIFDPLSYALLFTNASSSNPSTIQNASSRPGYRVWSGVANSSGVVALPTSIRYADISFNHAWNIAITNNTTYGNFNGNATGELQVYNGKYITKGTTTTGSYVDYNTYNCPASKSQYDYSGITSISSPKRYATFAWKCAASTPPYLYAKFMIYGCTQNMTSINNAGPISFTQSSTSYNMNVFFRFEDDMTIYNGMHSNTTWINATETNTLSPSANIDTSTIIGGKNAGIANTSVASGSNYTLTIYSQIPNINNSSSTNVYLYVRIELPMEANIGFSYVTARLDTSSIV